MTDRRRLTATITILVTADLISEDDSTNINVLGVSHNVMGSVMPVGDAPDTTEAWREAMATAAVKHGMQYLLNEMAGEHQTPPPKTNMPQGGASA